MNTIEPRLSPAPLPRHPAIHNRHLERLAIVYIRQSTFHQVHHHQESTRLQYQLVDRAVQLGWDRTRVITIDDDLGRSGTSVEGRPGFQRLVAEVGLDHVGLVLGLEASRLARSCRDWHQLLDICSVFGTLIGDADGIYDPTRYNDRLLLGLKGTMSEAELHILKGRLHQGRLAKALRGELHIRLPMGYIRRPSGEVIKDPDEQAQSVIALVFATFELTRTLHATLRYLVQHDIQMPVRLKHGPDKGDLQWRRPNRPSLQNLLHNPAYAGAYAYGRRKIDPRRQQPGRAGTGRVSRDRSAWDALIHNHHPAYISWEQYERNLAQLAANRTSADNVVRRGQSYLAGLVVCGRCGRRMRVQYAKDRYRYLCPGEAVDYGGDFCQSLQGACLDEAISAVVLRAVEPAALDVSLGLAEEIEQERAALERHWQQRLERAAQAVERAYRQYNRVEPENRLVARTLEQKWESVLRDQQQLQEAHARFQAEQPTQLSAAEREAIRQLATDVPTLWNAPTTTVQDRQEVTRLLVEAVVVTVVGESEKVEVEVQWMGRHRTALEMIRPVARWEQLSYYSALLERISELRDSGLRHAEIATQLNAETWRPPKRRPTFNTSMVRSLLSRIRPTSQTSPRSGPHGPFGPEEWGITALAQELGMPTITMYSWVRKGTVTAEKRTEDQRWIIYADAEERERLRAYRRRPRTWGAHTRVPDPS